MLTSKSGNELVKLVAIDSNLLNISSRIAKASKFSMLFKLLKKLSIKSRALANKAGTVVVTKSLTCSDNSGIKAVNIKTIIPKNIA